MVEKTIVGLRNMFEPDVVSSFGYSGVGRRKESSES